MKNKHKIYISLGTNISRERHTRSGLDACRRVFSNLRVSPVYESEAVGFNGHAFYNLVIEADTSLDRVSVCRLLKQIESENGRQRTDKKFAPRTLDLDLLLYDDEVTSGDIVLPREEITYNAFVLKPLCDLVPDKLHPVVGKTYEQIWDEYDKSQQKLWQISFEYGEVS